MKNTEDQEQKLAIFREELSKCRNPFRKQLLMDEIARLARDLQVSDEPPKVK